jgi:hypothetical protein
LHAPSFCRQFVCIYPLVLDDEDAIGAFTNSFHELQRCITALRDAFVEHCNGECPIEEMQEMERLLYATLSARTDQTQLRRLRLRCERAKKRYRQEIESLLER